MGDLKTILNIDAETGANIIGVTGNNGTFKATGEPAWSANPAIPANRKPIT